jgi:hypothetical protein
MITNNEAAYYKITCSLVLLSVALLFYGSYFLPEDGGGNSLRNIVVLGCCISVSLCTIVMSSNSSVSVETRIRVGRPEFQLQFTPDARNLSFPKRSNRLWGPPSLLFGRQQLNLPEGRVKEAGA